MHALILGDYKLLADLLCRDLKNIGYSSVATAHSEEEAIRLATEHCPDLIMVDDRLSAGAGVSAIKSICADKHIPIVYVTGNSQRVRQTLPDAVTIDSFGAAVLRTAVHRATHVTSA